ncbi:MAG: UvrD-helicase domain-containing protein, partial [Candidatus Glassbacteria bacterium]|nr:UvrD-helicase domain-containing protein [Candidatus Glassbacteria bacterium]
MREFDLLKSPLTGTNLIEASAGTGKTYTITGIYLRLVLEQGLGVERILVVTFTRDATAELRDRTRRALKSLLAEVECPGGAGGEELLQKLAAGYRDSGRRELALGRLSGALRTFDQAAISTIHGFCGRMLQENAFESAVPFDTELITDQSRLVREVVEDFWRRNFYELPPEVVQCAQQEIKSPGYFLGLARSHPSPARLNIVPQAGPLPPAELEKLLSGFRKTYHELRRAWPAAAEEVQELLAGSGLNARSYGGKVPALVKEMDDYLAPAEPALPLDFGNIARFTPEGLEASVTKQGTVPQHRILDLCASLSRSAGEVSRAAERHFLFLKTDLFRFLREELPLRKQQRNVQFYDDLLLGMLEAVRGETSRALVRTLREKYRAVLIDEFQDTDPVQYAVFSRVFAGGNSSLFLIGDPKQAIYGFRGADIFTYREAARQVERVYTLGRNWRSEPGLVESVNAIFSGVELPFVFDWIGFRPAEPARAPGGGELLLDGCCQAPLQLWLMDTGSLPDSLLTRDGFIRKGDARQLACRAVAVEVSRLVSLGREGRALLGGEPLKPGDIAVLVRRNAEAEQVRQALAALNIPSLLHEREYLFDTHEALELERVLAAVAEPGDEYLLRAALATDILGLDGESLAGLQEHESGLERWMNRFGQYNLTWQDHGFIRLFAGLVSAEKVRERLLGFADGERRLTNLVQLAEVLHRHSLESKPGIRGLVKWLSEQRDPDSPRPEELKVRLETDEDAVRVATVHKSKGLEYPVVFC